MADVPVELIQRIPLFSALDERELKEVAASMKERTFAAGRIVVEEGKGGVGFFVIDSGTASVTIGGRQVRTLYPGDYFGEIALISDSARTATVAADSELHCYGLTSWEFRPLVEHNASIAWKLLQALAERLSTV